MLKQCAFILFTLCLATTALAAKPVLENLDAPVGIIQDKAGNLYAAEWGGDRVSRFSPDGGRETLVKGVASPAGLAFGPAGELYIAGYGDGQIHAWTREKGLRPIAGGFSQPTGLLWDEPTGSLLIANRGAGEIVQLFPDGQRKTFSSGHSLPVGIARAANGDVFVSCYGGAVDQLAKDGSLKKSWHGLARPGVGILAVGDEIYCVDNGAGVVARLVPAGSGIIASGLKSPVGLTRLNNGQLLVGCWGDNAGWPVNFK